MLLKHFGERLLSLALFFSSGPTMLSAGGEAALLGPRPSLLRLTTCGASQQRTIDCIPKGRNSASKREWKRRPAQQLYQSLGHQLPLFSVVERKNYSGRPTSAEFSLLREFFQDKYSVDYCSSWWGAIFFLFFVSQRETLWKSFEQKTHWVFGRLSLFLSL